jgi:hypothetical protein
MKGAWVNRSAKRWYKGNGRRYKGECVCLFVFGLVRVCVHLRVCVSVCASVSSCMCMYDS